MFENPRRGRQAKNFGKNVPKILDLKSSSEQIFSENCRWVPLKFLEMATFGLTLIELLLYHPLHAFTCTSSLPTKSRLRLQKESKSTMLCPCEKEIVTKREMLHSSDIMHC